MRRTPAAVALSCLLVASATPAEPARPLGVVRVEAGQPVLRWQVDPERVGALPGELRVTGDGMVEVRVPEGEDASAFGARIQAALERIAQVEPPADDVVLPAGVPDPCLDPCLLYSGDGSGRLYSIDVDAGTSTFIGQMGTTMFDIAASRDGILYGIIGNQLYRIDACTAAITLLGSSVSGNGLTGDFASDGVFSQGPPLQRAALPALAPITVGGAAGGGPPFWCGFSSGDLSQSPADGLLYSALSCANCETLVAISPAGGAVVQQVGCFRDANTLQQLGGVFGVAHDCECRLWAGLSSGNVIYEIDPTTGHGIPHAIGGGYSGTFGLAAVPPAQCGNQPPTCGAVATATGCFAAALTGTGQDPEGGPLTFAWSASGSCAGAVFSPSASAASPDVTVPPGCRTCTFTLTVTDDQGATCQASADVTFADATPPVVSCPPDLVAECDGTGNAADRDAWLAQFSATDDCGPVTTTLETIPGILAGTIAYQDFCDLSALTLNGSTSSIHSCAPPPCDPVLFGSHCVLRLTNDLTQGGSAFTTSPISLATDASFSTAFSFQITDNQDCGGLGGADGLVFVIQTVANNVGGAGGGIGYEGIGSSVGIEFDTWDNGAPDANSSNHLGINLNGSTASVVLTPIVPDFNNGAVWHAWVDYDGASDQLEVRVGTTPVRPALPQASLVVDLVTVLGQTDAFVGFTSGTGCAGGDHDIRTWGLNNTFNPIGCAGTGFETATFTATDACGNSASCSRTFTIADTTPPALDGCPSDLVLSCTDAVPPPAAVTASDLCDADVAAGFAEVEEPGRCPGERTITRSWSAVDDCGNAATCTQVIQVRDTTPPVVGAGTLVGCLWSPNHEMVEVGLSIAATDDCTPDGEIVLAVASVTSDEATGTELGAGGANNHCPDAVIDGTRVWLRSERSGRSDGRVYRITVSATDACGNVALGGAEVRVPHDQSPKTPGQTNGNDPDGPCPAIDSPFVHDATACN